MNEQLIVEKPGSFQIPEDAVFESAPVLPHDAKAKPKSSSAVHLDGSSAKGDVVEYLHFDDHDNTFTHEMVQDIEPTLEWVKDQHSANGRDVGRNKEGDFFHVARVDLVVIQTWLNQKGLTMQDFKGAIVEQFLNDPSTEPFRLWKGRV